MMGQIAYVLCGLTSLVCFSLLLRAYLQTRSHLLLWSSLAFALFTIQNVLLVVDLLILPTQISLALSRTFLGFAGAMVLMCGLIWERR